MSEIIIPSVEAKKVEAKKMEDYSVAKSNEFINRSKYDLSVMEQRFLACMISMLDSRPRDVRENCDDILSGELSIDTFCELCHIEKRGSIKYIKEVLTTLGQRVFWIEAEEGKLKMWRWIDTAEIIPKSGLLRFTFSSCLKPYLLNLEKNFTSYKLPMVMRFSSRYANIIYDLVKAKHGQSYNVSSSLEISVEEMKKKVQVEHWDKKHNTTKIVNQNISFKDLRSKILEPAVEDINKCTDVIVELQYIKKGRKIDTICFIFRYKTKDEIQKMSLLKDVFANRI